MKTTTLLLASLVSTILLVAAVVVFIQDESAGLQAETPKNSAVDRQNADFGPEPARRRSLLTPSQRLNASSQALVQYTELSDEPVARVASLNQDITLSVPEARLLREDDESSKVDSGRSARNSSPGRTRWDTHPRTSVVRGVSASVQRSAPAAKGGAATESHPTAAPIQPATFAQEATSTPRPSTIAGTRATLSASAPVSEIPDRPAWPRGPFTIEEERYRAQFGDAALTAALREEAIGPGGQ